MRLALMDRMFNKEKNKEEVIKQIGDIPNSSPENLTFLTFCYHLPHQEDFRFIKSLKTSKAFDSNDMDSTEVCNNY